MDPDEDADAVARGMVDDAPAWDTSLSYGSYPAPTCAHVDVGYRSYHQRDDDGRSQPSDTRAPRSMRPDGSYGEDERRWARGAKRNADQSAIAPVVRRR